MLERWVVVPCLQLGIAESVARIPRPSHTRSRTCHSRPPPSLALSTNST